MIPLSCGASRLSSSSSGSGSSSSRSRSGSGSGSGSGSSSASSSSSSRYGNYTSRMPAEAIVTMQEMGTYVCCMHLFWPAVFTHTQHETARKFVRVARNCAHKQSCECCSEV